MRALDLGLGYTLLAMSVGTAALRAFGREELLGFRPALIARLGPRLGDAVHFVAYTLGPAALGLSFLVLAAPA